jgi:hypothetical protein
VTQADRESFEQRKDLRELRKEYGKFQDKGSAEAKRLCSRISKLIGRLSIQALHERRLEYFDQQDRRRAAGSKADEVSVTTFRPHNQYFESACTAAIIGGFLRREEVGEQRVLEFAEMLLAYLRGQPVRPAVVVTEDADNAKETDSDELRPNKSQCLLCLAGFASRTNLTKHFKTIHMEKGVFNKPFACPECRRLGRGDCMVDNPSTWSGHIWREHRRADAPYKPLTDPDAVALLPQCLLCGKDFSRRENLTRHNRRCHFDKGEFSQPFACPECRRLGRDDYIVDGPSAWSSHVEKSHGRIHIR